MFHLLMWLLVFLSAGKQKNEQDSFTSQDIPVWNTGIIALASRESYDVIYVTCEVVLFSQSNTSTVLWQKIIFWGFIW